MKVRLLISILSGLVLPWLFFVFVTVTPMGVYEDGVLVRAASDHSGLAAFIELNSFENALLIYLKIAVIIACVVYISCDIAHRPGHSVKNAFKLDLTALSLQ